MTSARASDTCALNALQLSGQAATADSRLVTDSKSGRTLSSIGAKFVRGSWSEDQKSFHYAKSTESDLLFTWTLGRTSFNVTATEAMKWAGPLTLLEALQECSQGVLAEILPGALLSGNFVLHVIGVSGALEPMMDWDHFLVGPLTTREALIVKAFALPVTPFAGTRVSLLFNKYENSDLVKRKAAFPEGYVEQYAFGTYHEAVKDVPDLVLALNPGFAHYPQIWWATLKHLATNRVPLVATGYGETMRTVFEFFPNIASIDEHSQLPEAWLNNSYPVALLSVPGGAPMSLARTSHVSNYVDATGDLAYRKHVFPIPTGRETGPFVNFCNRSSNADVAEMSSVLDEEWPDVSGVCSDLNGTFFLGRRAGYAIQFSSQNVFQYCDDSPIHAECASNGVMMILKPAESATRSFQNIPLPANIFEETMMSALRCALLDYPALVACVERRLLAGPQSHADKLVGMFDNMDKFFYAAASHCAGHDINNDLAEALKSLEKSFLL
eukprot:TRINITY_DN41736_c0_g1_i1.p1 TRINITY_DN41736_c0_g1~~TRINITY_DN41736_c0_g1_i1.p1  ORF type:complete len:498 (+),score=71.18 TRINITY_DN41736_c0_g1_i1:142-1635(+)